MKKTQQLHQIIKTVGIFSLILAIVFSSAPISALAQTSDTSQAAAYRNGIANSSQNSSGNYSKIATNTVSCSAGQLLSGYVMKLVSGLVGTVTDKGQDAIAKIDEVSVNSRLANDQLRAANSAAIGHVSGIGTPDLPGWDSVAWCVVNSMITYISDSVITWANRGFNGNPAFIDNMDNFLEDLADREAGQFISSLAKDITGGGINLCSPFKIQIAIGLSNYYGSGNSFSNRSSCTLGKVVKNIDGFVNGNFNEGGWAGWFSMTQNQQNNAIGATLLSIDELNARITKTQNGAKLELGLNRGFLNYKKCETPGDAKSCKTVTPGIVIQTELEKSLGLPKDRLVIAQKFDQMVEAIVNSLIKVALNEALSTSKK